MDTIVALSSGALPSGVAVVRLSGPEAFFATRKLLRHPIEINRTLRLCDFVESNSLETVDRGLVCGFSEPNSFTGEDVVELHLHGSRAVVDRVLQLLTSMEGIRIADPGEFARRAFLNRKIDLTAAEGLADLIDAQTDVQRRLANRIAGGELAGLYDGWRSTLLRMRAMLEADIDFADEDDVPGSVVAEVFEKLPSLTEEMRAHLSQIVMADRVREGFVIAIVGPPNAGKSTLLNTLAGRDVAIVTDVPGTTRDTLEVQLNLGGFLVRLVDTAGLRETDDLIEQEGVRRARSAMSDADLILELSSDGKWSAGDAQGAPRLKVVSKTDLQSTSTNSMAHLAISAQTGDGIERLVDRLAEEVSERLGVFTTRASGNRRHASKIQSAIDALVNIDQNEALEINAELLRDAASNLAELTGEIGTEDMLGEIFSSFCIGK